MPQPGPVHHFVQGRPIRSDYGAEGEDAFASGSISSVFTSPCSPHLHLHIYGRRKGGKTWAQPVDMPKAPGTFGFAPPLRGRSGLVSRLPVPSSCLDRGPPRLRALGLVNRLVGPGAIGHTLGSWAIGVGPTSPSPRNERDNLHVASPCGSRRALALRHATCGEEQRHAPVSVEHREHGDLKVDDTHRQGTKPWRGLARLARVVPRRRTTQPIS